MPGVATGVATRRIPGKWQIEPLGSGSNPRDRRAQPVTSGSGAAVLMQCDSREDAALIAELLRWYRGTGSIRLIRKHRDMLLLEWLEGLSLADLMQQRRDGEAIAALSDVAAKLHRARRSLPKCSLTPLAEHWRPLLTQRFAADPLTRHAARLARNLLETTIFEQVLHGGLTLDAIRRHDERGWLAGLPIGLYGDPHYDFAPALTHPCRNGPGFASSGCVRERAMHIAGRRGLDCDRLLTFAFCRAVLSLLTAEHHGEPAFLWRDRSQTLLDSLVIDTER